MKRILTMGDLHSGHLFGLTPPRWQLKPRDVQGRRKREKAEAFQRESWNWYSRRVTALGPYDLVVVNGDCIDGTGLRSGGTELLTTDRIEQCTIAEACIQRAMGKGCKLVMTYGTPYHVSSDGEDWEDVIAGNLNADKIGSHEWITTEGVTFDVKHKIGSSQTPQGRATAGAKEDNWNALWAEEDLAPRGDIFIRSHVHYCEGSFTPSRVRITLPALQGMGSKFGSRQCSGIVHFGFVVWEVHRGTWDWHIECAKLQAQKAKAYKL